MISLSVLHLSACVDNHSQNESKNILSEDALKKGVDSGSLTANQPYSLIIEFDIPNFNELTEAEKASVIRIKESELQKSMQGNSFIVKHRYTFTPTILVVVNSEGKAKLYKNDLIKSISENSLDKIAK